MGTLSPTPPSAAAGGTDAGAAVAGGGPVAVDSVGSMVSDMAVAVAEVGE